MKLNSISILHIYAYIKQTGERSPVDLFIKDVNPFKLSTCMRHVYLFDLSVQTETEKSDTGVSSLRKKEAFDSLISNLENAPDSAKCKYQHLHGIDAYSFLLYWSIGGLNEKRPFQDDRLIGEIRKNISEYCDSGSPKKQALYNEYKTILDCLMIDVKKMHAALLSMRDISLEEKKKLFKIACDNCARKRGDGTLELLPKFNYIDFTDDEAMERQIFISLNEVEKKFLEGIEKIKSKKQVASFFYPLTRKTKSLSDLRTILNNSNSRKKVPLSKSLDSIPQIPAFLQNK